MERSILLSIIIPVYNTPLSYLKECLASLEIIGLKKTEYEIIIINDGSTNKELNNYLATLKNIILLEQRNKGVSSAKNFGIEKSLGEYIYILDSDDKISEEFNVFLDVILKDKTIEVLYGDYFIFGDINHKYNYPTYNRLQLFYDQNLVPSCSFFRKEVWHKVGGFDEEFKTVEDWDFWIRCAIKDIKFTKIDHSAYHHRVVENGLSLSQQSIDKEKKNIEIMRSRIPSLKLTKEELDEFAWGYIQGYNNTYRFRELVNETVTKSFKKKKRKALAMLFYIYTPSLYKVITKLGGFSFKERFI